jgi:hypothetical protein
VTGLVEAIRAERRALIEPLLAPVADKLRTLDEMEHLARSLNGGGSDEVPAVAAPRSSSRAKTPAKEQRALPATTRPTGQGLDGLNSQSVEALAKVRDASGPVSRVEIGASNTVMATLVRRGLVEAHSDGRWRKYTAATNGSPARKRTTFGQGRPAALKAGPSLQGRVLEACGWSPGSVDDLATRLKADAADVTAALDALAEEGEIVALDDGRYRAT